MSSEKADAQVEGIAMANLWRHGDFMRLWAGETVEWFTDSVTSLAVPTIAILTFKASAFDMGILTSLGYVAYPLLGLFAGVMVDRWRRRPVLVWTNIMQFVALASIPVAFVLGILSLYQLFVVAFVMSITTVFFYMSYTSYLPTLIDRADLLEGNSKLETSLSSTLVVGPGFAGILIQLVGAASSVTVDALGTLFAGLAILSIKKTESPKPNAKEHLWREMQEGLRYVADSAVLRSVTAATSVLNLGSSMFYAVLYLFIYNQLLMSPTIAGLALAVGAVGSVIGAVIAPRVLTRIGVGGSLIAALVIYGAGLMTIPASIYGAGPLTFAALWLFANIGLPLYNISQISLRQTIVPDELQGRMNATIRTFGYGAATVGALLGGILGVQFGVTAVMTIGGVISLLATIVVCFGPVGKIKGIPRTVLHGEKQL